MRGKSVKDGAKPVLAAEITGGDFRDEEFAAIRELLLARRGVDLGSYKDGCIRRRIARRIRALGLNNAASYIALLRHGDQELDGLMEALTIHVSQFFRNPSVFQALEAKVLPDILRRVRRPTRPIRFASFGCSSGEEPYSLALLLEKMAPHVPVSILATDLSETILRQAREGLYDPMRMTEVPEAMRERFFKRDGRHFRLLEHVRARVTYRPLDLLADDALPQADLVLCRNVLIYFSRKEQESILARISASLPQGGWLVLGKAETLMGEARGLFAADFPAERIYRRLPVR